MYKKQYLIFVIFLTVSASICSQTTVKPNFGLKSHETLDIYRIETTAEKTVVYFTIENRIEKGSFCADKNIFLIDPAGKRMKLTKASGIPVCPETYNFNAMGEKLQFTLEFPSLKGGTKWIDIVEECASNCFWFYGVTLDIELNKRLDEAFSIASSGKPAENIVIFSSLLESIGNQNPGIEGLLYINIINSAAEDGDNINAKMWYNRLTDSKAPRLNYYIKYLNDRKIKY